MITKERILKGAAGLAVLAMISSTFVGGTFAKYTTSADSNDAARVAYWGFQPTNSMDLTGLFTSDYTDVLSVNGDDVIAPGTSGSTTFSFAWDETVSSDQGPVAVTGPEVAYEFKVDVVENCDDLIKNNKNIQWKLDNGAWGTWDELIASIKNLSGDTDGVQNYAPNTLPAAFSANDDVHTIEWQWLFEGNESYIVKDENGVDKMLTQDEYDTLMGNAETLDDCALSIDISATQTNN